MNNATAQIEQGTRVKITSNRSASRFFVLGYEGEYVYLVQTSANSTSAADISMVNLDVALASDIEADPKGKAQLISAWKRFWELRVAAQAVNTPAPAEVEPLPASSFARVVAAAGCSTCDAPAGENCARITEDGTRRPLGRNHRSRVLEANAATL